MRYTFTPVSRLIAATLVLAWAAGPVAADSWQPAPQSHQETWYSQRGGVLKSFVFTYQPNLSFSNGETRVSIREKVDKRVDEFAGVAGEIDFSRLSLIGVTLYLDDGSTETCGRSGRTTVKGKVVGIKTRHHLVGNDWTMSWSALPPFDKDGFAGPDGERRANELAQRLSGSSRAMKVLFYEMNWENIWGCDLPGGGLYLETTEGRHASEDALDEAREALEKLNDVEGALEPADALEATSQLLHAMKRLDEHVPERPELLHETATQMERLNKAGLGIEEYFKLRYGDEDPEALKFIEKTLKWVKATATVAEMRKTGEVNVKRFYDDTIGLIPSNLAPVLQGPGGVFLRDKLEWDQKMWSTSTSGLDLVAEAMETGSLDGDRLAEISGRLNRLADEGPWGAESGQSFLKKMVGGVPVVGKVLAAIW